MPCLGEPNPIAAGSAFDALAIGGGQRGFDHFIELTANGAIAFGEDFAGCSIHHHRTGNGLNTVFYRHCRFPAAAVANLRPGHALLTRKGTQTGLGLRGVQTNAQYVESLGVKFLIGGHDVGKFGAAGAAPRRPKIQEHNPPLIVGREVDGFSGERFRLERRGLLARSYGRPIFHIIGPHPAQCQGQRRNPDRQRQPIKSTFSVAHASK